MLAGIVYIEQRLPTFKTLKTHSETEEQCMNAEEPQKAEAL